mgnify:CR=1 FL=1
MVSVCRAALLLTCAATLWAADPMQMDRVAARLLDSPRAVDQAWGAYYAGRLELKELGPKLIERLATPAGGSREESDALVRGLLGAAIECDVEVPLEILRRYESHWPAETIILLGRVPENEDHLLELRETVKGDTAWFAVSNLLLQHKSSRHLRRILSELELIQAVTVVDGPPRFGYGSSLCPGGGIFTIPGADPKGFPPTGTFGLVILNPGPGDRLLAEGPQNAYYRHYPATPCPGGCVGGPGIDRKTSAVQYLAWMLHEPEGDLQRILHQPCRIRWAGAAAYRASVRAALAGQEAAIRRRINRLDPRLRRDLPGLNLRIQVTVRDQREHRTAPLPAIPPHTITLVSADAELHHRGSVRADAGELR